MPIFVCKVMQNLNFEILSMGATESDTPWEVGLITLALNNLEEWNIIYLKGGIHMYDIWDLRCIKTLWGIKFQKLKYGTNKSHFLSTNQSFNPQNCYYFFKMGPKQFWGLKQN